MDIAQADAQIRVRFIEKVRAALDPYIHGTEVVIDINSKRVEHVGVTRSPTKGAGMKVLRTAIQAPCTIRFAKDSLGVPDADAWMTS